MSVDDIAGGTRQVRAMELTPELVARLPDVAPDPGPEAGYELLTDEDYDRFAAEILAELNGDALWLFAYGSLIWKPDFEHDSALPGELLGYRRSFCMDDQRWRARPETPGLIMCLDRGGSCQGMAYRLPLDDMRARVLRLLRRETSYRGNFDAIRWLTVETAQGPLKVLTFWVAPLAEKQYLPLPEAEQARRIAQAVGHLGSAAAYLQNTVVHLEELGMHDPYLWRLQRLVAAEIQARA